MLRFLTSRTAALIKNPNAHAALVACVLIWAYLYQHNAVLYTVALFLGSCLVCTASVSPMAATRQEHHITTGVQCAAMVLLGVIVQGLALDLFAYKLSLVFMHFWMMCLSEDNDRTSSRTSHAITYFMIAETIVLLSLSYFDKPVSAWALTLMFVATLAWWRHSLWHSIGSQPLSNGQHSDYWPQLFAENTPSVFWKTLRNYVGLYPIQNTPANIMAAVSHVDLCELLEFLKTNAFNQFDVQTPDDRIAHAVKLRINQMEPRAQYVWELFGESHTRAAAEAIANLDVPKDKGIALELPCLA